MFHISIINSVVFFGSVKFAFVIGFVKNSQRESRRIKREMRECIALFHLIVYFIDRCNCTKNFEPHGCF